MHHDLKIWTDFFGKVVRGDKKAEVRSIQDRHFAVDDTVTLNEWYPHLEKYSGSKVDVRITDVTPLDRVGVKGWVVFSFEVIRDEQRVS